MRASRCLCLTEVTERCVSKLHGRTCCSPTQVKNLNRGGGSAAQITLQGRLLFMTLHTHTHTHLSGSSLLRYLRICMAVALALLQFICSWWKVSSPRSTGEVTCLNPSLFMMDEFFLHDNLKFSRHIIWWFLCT